MPRLRPLAALLTAGLLALGAPAALAGQSGTHPGRHRQVERTAPAAPSVTSPTGTQQQVEADRPIPVPDTRSCTETLMVHDFANSYGAPYTGTYTPPAGCPGPWARVVLTLTSTVGGVQYDRDVYVAIGDAIVLDGSTSEPCCTGSNAVTWTVQRDMTPYTALLSSSQPVRVELDNVQNSTYTGIYHTVVTLTFYEPGRNAPAPAEPDVVLPVSNGGAMLGIGSNGQTVGSEVTFPRNLVRLEGELFADAHGPCEEFWWSDPTNCAGTPYREVAVYIDGRLAGAAPVYPVTYTGADGPGLWEPIPSPRAWDLRPYDVDLTPFVGLLTDGQPHQVTLGVLDASLGSGDFWAVAANLLGWVDPRVSVVKGSLTTDTAPAAPSDEQAWDPSGTVLYTDTAGHQLSFAGVLHLPGGPVVTRVQETMGEQDQQTQATVRSTWTWDAVTTTEQKGVRTVTDSQSTYSALVSDLTHFTFTDANRTTVTSGKAAPAWTAFAERMSTSAPTGIAYNGVERESYGYGDSSGVCYDHVLDADGGEITVNRYGSNCPK
jgi:hypothetical protein